MPKKSRGATRRLKKVTPVPLMQMISGFWASKTLASAVELDLFTKLSGRHADVHQLSQLLGIHPRPAEMLLSACTALGLLGKRDKRFSNSSLSEEYLVKGKPCYFGGVVTLLDRRLYLPWNRLLEALRTNRAQTWEDHSDIFEQISSNLDKQRLFTEGMHSFSVQSGKALAAAFDFSQYTQLLDVGGASGAYCIEAVRRYLDLRAVVFDLPTALEITQEKIAESGFSDRIITCPGNFFTEELPKGSDVILLSMILHDWDPERNLMILHKCFNALPSGGTVIISELMMDDNKAGPVSAALMSLNMLIETEAGRNYSWAEYTEWLEKTGFKKIERIAMESPGANGILVGYKS
ncbi:MAG TPA: methyltransferase [Thermodesulfobacteriota bacterium]|nr:methyltransferase [Thermodesulfobacteriota bacterium]